MNIVANSVLQIKQKSKEFALFVVQRLQHTKEKKRLPVLMRVQTSILEWVKTTVIGSKIHIEVPAFYTTKNNAWCVVKVI